MQFCAMIITLGSIPHNKQAAQSLSANHPTQHNTFEEYFDVADVCQDPWLMDDLYIQVCREDIAAVSNDVLCSAQHPKYVYEC